jgi:hypothetical protein
MDVLIHISQQLSNSTMPAFEPAVFQVSSSTAAVNMLFFLSLALVLIDAFLAMLVKGWLQEFDRGWRKCTVANLRAEERERRLQELERWKLHELVALLPILIQGSLFLFCIGLLVLIFPLHPPSAILCSLIFVCVVGFYGFTTYLSIIDDYAPFSSPVSRLLTRGLAILQTQDVPITQSAQRVASAVPLHSRPSLPQGQPADRYSLHSYHPSLLQGQQADRYSFHSYHPSLPQGEPADRYSLHSYCPPPPQGQQADRYSVHSYRPSLPQGEPADRSSLHSFRPPLPQGQSAYTDFSTQPLPSNKGVATLAHPNSVENSNMVPRSHSGIEPRAHVHVLERLVTTTAEAVENIPIFLELLDQPVKDPTLRPSDMEKWKGLLHITFRLLREQSTVSVSAAWTLARTTMICYDRETADQQLELLLQDHLGSRETDNQRPRIALHLLFSSYLRFRLGHSSPNDLWRTIAFLEPSDAADAELLWMVDTSHRIIHCSRPSPFEYYGTPLDVYYGFFEAVLTYISSSEQSRRSKAPLTAAVIYALRTIRSALDQGGIDPIETLFILPRGLSASDYVPMTFSRVDGLYTVDLWSEECIQFVKDLLQRSPYSYFRLSLIVALYIDSTKQAHTRSTFATLLKRTSITDIQFELLDAYDPGKLAAYLYMAITREPPKGSQDPLDVFCDVIENIITKSSILRVSGLYILDIAMKHFQKIVSTTPSVRLIRQLPDHMLCVDGKTIKFLVEIDDWVLLHLSTLLAPKPYFRPEDVRKLEWSDTPEKVHIATARLDLYDSLARAGHEAGEGPKPDPGLLRVFLWSTDREVCTRAFRWYLDLVLIHQSGSPGGANSSSMFIPESIGDGWVEHFIHVLSKGTYWVRVRPWGFLKSALVPKWGMLPASWCRDFASAILFSIVRPQDMYRRPAYQYFAKNLLLDELQEFLPFLATLLQLVKSSLTWASLTSIEHWLDQLPEGLENQNAHTIMRRILSARRQQLTLEFFMALPMAVTVTSL